MCFQFPVIPKSLSLRRSPAMETHSPFVVTSTWQHGLTFIIDNVQSVETLRLARGTIFQRPFLLYICSYSAKQQSSLKTADLWDTLYVFYKNFKAMN
jgi:hypothetical protein